LGSPRKDLSFRGEEEEPCKVSLKTLDIYFAKFL
jgi:hypothetical protein